ncbi:MAG TPA: pitrilysin family protein [Armatimonadota bacterium]|nr:pitrilysin family protein [Armatimonadota bacterium]
MVRKDVLPNGVRVLTETVPHIESVSVGIWVTSGARAESASRRGISHFIEHMLFKGTETRTAKQIADEFDFIGGQLNAFSEKEYTCYFARVLAEHLPCAVDVLTDMLLNSTLAPHEIELEKNVVLEEIKRHEDTPDELVHDLFAETAWGGHPLGHAVLGNRESVEKLTRDGLVEFMLTKYTPDGVVVAAAGNLVHEELVDKISSLFGGMKGKKADPSRTAPSFSGKSVLADKDTEQVHFCIGAPGFSQLDPEKYTLVVIDATLGGGMSSRLFQKIREERGLVYAIGSYSPAYREGGLFAVYGGTSLKNVEEVLRLIRSEFSNVLTGNITAEELTRAKNQIRGALVLAQESMSSRMIRMAKSELYFGRPVPLEEVIDAVLKVTHDDIAQVASQIFGESAFAVAAVGPFKDQEVVIS